MGAVWSVIFVSYYTSRTEVKLYLNMRNNEKEKKQLMEVLNLLPIPVIIASKDVKSKTPDFSNIDRKQHRRYD